MLTIPVKLDLDTGAAEAALKKFESGAKDALDEIVGLDGKKVNIDFKFSSSGDPIVKELTDTEAALKKTTDAWTRLTGGQAESIGRTKKIIKQFKDERDQLNKNSQEYKEADATVKKFEAKLRSLQGVQSGSIAEIKAQRAELVLLRNAARINSPEFNKLTGEIAKLDRTLGATRPKTNAFVAAFAKIAVVNAGLQAVGASLRSVGNAVDVYQRRTKEVEGFNLAIQNVGFTQGETNRIFKQAEATANALGAPLQQVEKSYRRMIPALQAVGTSAADSDKFIAAVSARSQTLGLNTEQSGRLLEAFAQVLSKGKLQAEELNQQISELDGAFRVQFADALGVTTEALNELISSSQITADVFVDTVNKMENGVEELENRVKNGTATFQQFQNLISNIETKNIEIIGKAIGPALKSFQEIRLAIAKFIKEFTKTAQFDALVNIFNDIAKGAELFVKNLLAVISAINDITAPLVRIIDLVLQFGDGFGGLTGILTQVALAIGVIVVATKSFIALRAGIAYVTAQFVTLSHAINGTGAFAAKAGPSIAQYGTAVALAGNGAERAAVKIKGLLAGFAQFAVIAGVVFLFDKVVQSFQASDKAAEEMSAKFGSINFDFAEDLKRINKQNKEVAESTKNTTESLVKQSVEAGKAGTENRKLGAGLAAFASGLGLAAVTVVTGGVPTLIALGAAAITGGFAVNKLNTSVEQLSQSGEGLEYLKKNLEFDSLFLDGIAAIRKLGGEVGQLDFSKVERGNDTLATLANNYKANAKALREQNSALRNIIVAEEQKENGNKAIIADARRQIQLNSQLADSMEKSAEKASEEIVLRIKQGNAADGAAASLEDLKEATDQLLSEVGLEEIKASTDALNKFGRAANSASLLAAANIGIARGASEERQNAFENELNALRAKEQLNGELDKKEKDRIRELTTLIAKETQTQTQLGIDARNAVIDAFEEGIDRAEQKVDTLAGAASRLQGSFDNVTGNLTSGLQAATGLIDEVVSREIKGLDVGSAKRVQIIQRQLRAQAVANNVENRIAQLKLSVQNRIATSQARIDQLRFQNEARIAQARGQNDIAAAFREAAGIQNQVIQGLDTQFKIESQVLAIQKATNDQKLINKGLDEKVGNDARNVADAIGVQVVNLDQAERKLAGMIGLTNKYSQDMANSATAAQDNAEAAQKTSLQQGVDDARAIADALDGAQGAAEGLGAVMSAANTSFVDVENTTQRIAGYIEVATKEAGKLQRIIIGGGAPARAMGGPVTGGKQYTVNDGGGREGFLSNSGKFSMLPAARNMKWTAPTSGTVIPANMVSDFLSAASTDRINKASASSLPRTVSSGLDSGNLVKQMTAAMSASGGNQRITNNVTIQSQQPVTDASQIMTNVARMRLRNARRI